MKWCDGCGKALERNDNAFGITGGTIRHEDFVPGDESWHYIFCEVCLELVENSIKAMKEMGRKKK